MGAGRGGTGCSHDPRGNPAPPALVQEALTGPCAQRIPQFCSGGVHTLWCSPQGTDVGVAEISTAEAAQQVGARAGYTGHRLAAVPVAAPATCPGHTDGPRRQGTAPTPNTALLSLDPHTSFQDTVGLIPRLPGAHKCLPLGMGVWQSWGGGCCQPRAPSRQAYPSSWSNPHFPQHCP